MSRLDRDLLLLDMGGTFTDGYVTDGVRAMVCKVPTTHFDLSQSVVGCLRRAAEGRRVGEAVELRVGRREHPGGHGGDRHRDRRLDRLPGRSGRGGRHQAHAGPGQPVRRGADLGRAGHRRPDGAQRHRRRDRARRGQRARPPRSVHCGGGRRRHRRQPVRERRRAGDLPATAAAGAADAAVVPCADDGIRQMSRCASSRLAW